MKSKNKIVKRTTAFFGLAAIPAAAALGLFYGIKDEKIDLRLSPAKDFGERYFDNKIVKVNDDEFASNILYDPLKRNGAADFIKNKKDNEKILTAAQEKSADIAGLVRLDRKLDIKYAHSVIEVEPGDTDQGSIDVDGGLKYPFHNIKEIVNNADGTHLFGKDIIKGMEEDAKVAITKTVFNFRQKHSSEKTLRLGIYFDKNVIDRTVSIYLYELKDFDPEQKQVINDFVNHVDSIDVDSQTAQEWIKNFSYSVDLAPADPLYKLPAARESYDRIDGKTENIKLNGRTFNTGFPEFFAAANIMGINEMDDWFKFGGISTENQYDLAVTGEGKIAFRDYTGGVMTSKKEFERKYPSGYKIDTLTNAVIKWEDIARKIKQSNYVNFDSSLKNNPIINNSDVTDKGPHILGPVQFAVKGITPVIEPSVDFKNNVLKIKYTFKAFRKAGENSSRAVGSFSMGEDISNPYEICTYVKEIPLDNMGNEGKDGSGTKIDIDHSTKKFTSFYTNETSHLDEKATDYNSLKASVMKSLNDEGTSKARWEPGKEVTIDRKSARKVLKEFLTVKTPEYASIPIVGPGMGILGQMIPSIAAAAETWMSFGNMFSADPTMGDKIFDDHFLDTLIDDINANPLVNITEVINVMNGFTKEAWSDLNSLINLSGKVENDETYSRTFQLFHLLGSISTISDKVMNKIKTQFPDEYMGSSTSVIEQLMNWLKKNGIISSDDSLMDIVHDYRTRLGTIVESIGINRPTMQSDLIQQLVDLVPLPLFSKGGSQFNRDTAAVLDALLNGKYIKPNSDEKNEERILPAIIALLNGGQRTSVQTFFQHILNDKPADLMKFVLGVIGADFSKGDTFAEAIKAIWTMFEAKVPDYVFDIDGTIKVTDKLDGDGKPVTTASGTHVQVPVINKDADGNPKMIMNPTFGGIGVALEKMYTGGIHSIPKDSYDSVLKFIFGTVASMVDMGTLSQTEEAAAAQGIFDFVTNGAGHHKNPDGTISETTPADVNAIIRVVNAIANKEIISPDFGPFIIAILKTGVGSLSTHDIEPLAKMLLPKLQPMLGFDKDKMTSSRLSEIFHDLFTGYQNNGGVDQLIKDIEELVPAISGMKITAIGGIEDLFKVIYSGKYPNLFSNPALSLAEPNLKPLQNILTDGLGNLNDEQWGNVVSGIRSIMDLAGSFIHGDLGDKLKTIFGSDESASAFVGVGHLISQGAGTVGAHDISMILELINRLDIGFKLPDGTKPDGHKDLLPDGKQNPKNPDVLHSFSFMIENILQNGVELSTLDIDTIMNLANIFGGSKFASIISMINAGNPEQLTGQKAPQVKEDAVKDLLIDFIVGYKYVGHADLYAKDKVTQLKIPQKVQLLKGASKPGKQTKIHIHKPDGDEDVLVDNPAYWDDNEYLRLVNEFNNLKTEIQLGYKNYKDEDHHGDAYTPEELFEKLIRAQSIPNELEAINSKIDAANAKVKIFYDALAAFKASNAQIQSVSEVKPSPTLSGDEADYAQSIDTLFKLLKSKMLAASSEATFTTLHGGIDANGKQHFQTGTIIINDHKALYSATKGELDKLNDLITELNSGKVGADFEDRMGKLFTSINTQFSGQGIKGVMPGIPAALKNMLKDFFAHNTVGSDGDGVKYEWSLFGRDTLGQPSSAAKSFAKFFVDNWKALFDHGGVFTDETGRGIVRYLGGSWSSPIGKVTQITGKGKWDNIMFKDLVTKIHQAEAAGATDPVDTKLMQALIDEFQKRVS